MEKTQIKVEATINADLRKVWEFYTSPEHIIKWNFADSSWQCPKAENDLQPGGKYLARMEAKDGSFGFDFEAIYDEVMAHQKIAYTMTDGRQATTHFVKMDHKTKVTTTFDAETSNPIEMQQQGWQAILNNFANYTERN